MTIDIDLYGPEPEDGSTPGMITGGAFEDAHSDAWWDLVHQQRKMILLAGDTPAVLRSIQTDTSLDMVSILREAFVGILPLTIRMWPSGIGTHPERA